MDIMIGIVSIIFMCSVILVLTSLVASQLPEGIKKSAQNKNDPYSYLFNVYQDLK
ncbi:MULTISPECIES: hypothetical protein [Sutcliffiella]|uniref:hypothetical protein n=1 Tax=Sutcliffiella TaxID=2837511 RepID=UPI000AF593D0|nr:MULTISPECIES: hypothetical protein [Sutcliffiella]WBL15562.1 hypothetical protein O1A01_02610 [Sutcliffiella sp. NC1]